MKYTHLDFSPLSAHHFNVYYFPFPVLHAGYLCYYTALSQFVQFIEYCVRLPVGILNSSPACCLAAQNHCEEKRKKFMTRRINNKLPSHFRFDTCRHSVEFSKVGESTMPHFSIFFHLGE